MATISSTGIGSGLDINGLITRLMTVERQSLSNLDKRESTYTTKISALGSLKSAVAAFQSAAAALVPDIGQSATDAYASFSAAVADTSIASATATTDAVAGAYSLEVSALAQSHRLVSPAGAYATSSAAIATGTLTIATGSSSTDIVIDSSNATLAGLRDAINDADAGVSATIVTGTNGAQLLISADEPGASNKITLSGLTGFDFDGTTETGTLSQAAADGGQAAQDAALTLNGIPVTSSSNSVSDALDGVTITLKAVTTSPTTLTVTRDTTTELTDGVEAFVKAYNDVVKQYKDLGYFNEATKTAGPLNGDYTLRLVQTRLRSTLFGSLDGLTGSIETLAQIGVTTQADGTLALDSADLEAAIASNYGDVAEFVSTLADAVDTTADTLLDSEDGTITSATDNLNQMIDGIDDRRTALENRLTQVEARYRRQFSALDSYVASMNSTSAYLQQQLASLPGSSSN